MLGGSGTQLVQQCRHVVDGRGRGSGTREGVGCQGGAGRRGEVRHERSRTKSGRGTMGRRAIGRGWQEIAGDRGQSVRESSREGEQCLHLAPTVFVPSFLAEQSKCGPLFSPYFSHLTPVTSHQSLHTCHLTPVTSHLSPQTCLSPHTCHLKPVASNLSLHTSLLLLHTGHLTPVAVFLLPCS